MENNITPEIIEKAKAAECFSEMHTSGELSDDELENVSGGGCKAPKIKDWGCEDFVCASCGSHGFGKHCNGLNAECKYCRYADRSSMNCIYYAKGRYRYGK